MIKFVQNFYSMSLVFFLEFSFFSDRMSSDLVWQVIRKNNAFKRRQRGIQKHFSVEKFNLRAVHSQRHSGLASRKALDVQPASDGKSILLSVKQPSKHLSL